MMYLSYQVSCVCHNYLVCWVFQSFLLRLGLAYIFGKLVLAQISGKFGLALDMFCSLLLVQDPNRNHSYRAFSFSHQWNTEKQL